MRRLTSVLIGILIVAAAIGALWPWLMPQTGPNEKPIMPDAALRGTFTLAVSWQPAFCETAPRRPECQSQTRDRFDATHLALHGLWPEPAGNVYCNVPQAVAATDRSGQWQQLPAPELNAETSDRLALVMPGTQSRLERHEWIKHGTCAGATGERYFATAVALVDALESAGIGALFAANIGATLSASDVRSAFDRAFGADAGKRVTLECERVSGRTLIAELRIGLQGEIAEAPDVSSLIAAADVRERGCPGGEIDVAG